MTGLLDGVRVLDLSQMLAGPFGTMMLADLGADVIKIETLGEGDRTRSMGPHFIQGESAYFISINRNKKSVTINLKEDEGRKVFYDLVKHADVVFDNFRPGVTERLKIDHDCLAKINPKIVTVSISAYGVKGPYQDLPAFDLTIQALGGAMSYTGEPGRDPVRMGIPMGDLAGAMFSAYSIVSALYAREKTGKGAHVDISLIDSIVALHTYVVQYYLFSGQVPQPIGSAHQSVVPYQSFKTKDIYIVIAVYTDKFWEGLCRALGVDNLTRDPRFSNNEKRRENRTILIPMLADIFRTKPGHEWLEIINKHGVPCAPINTIDRVVSDPQILQNGMIAELDIPGYGKLKTLGNPVKVKGHKDTYRTPPKLGENTEEILKSLCGYSGDKIRELKEKKII